MLAMVSIRSPVRSPVQLISYLPVPVTGSCRRSAPFTTWGSPHSSVCLTTAESYELAAAQSLRRCPAARACLSMLSGWVQAIELGVGQRELAQAPILHADDDMAGIVQGVDDPKAERRVANGIALAEGGGRLR